MIITGSSKPEQGQMCIRIAGADIVHMPVNVCSVGLKDLHMVPLPAGPAHTPPFGF